MVGSDAKYWWSTIQASLRILNEAKKLIDAEMGSKLIWWVLTRHIGSDYKT